MSAAWLVRTLLIGVLFSIAAIAASAAAEQSGRPRRWAWLFKYLRSVRIENWLGMI